MENLHSISKGSFVLGSASPVKRNGRRKNAGNVPLSPESFFVGELWKEKFSQIWSSVSCQLNAIEENAADTLLNDLICFVEESPSTGAQIPAAAILTGVNLPDHASLFRRLDSKLKLTLSRVDVALVDGSDCASLRRVIERTVSQFIGNHAPENELMSDEEEEAPKATSREHFSLPKLVEHFKTLTMNETRSPTKKIKYDPKLVVLLQDFETLAPTVVNRFIQILSGYRDRLPMVLVFGVATSLSALGDVLDHKAISRLSIKQFVAEPSVKYLNRTLDEVFLTPACPFQLSGKCCKFFTEVFLFYDFSVNRFIQGVKYIMLEHFMDGGRIVGLLCCDKIDLKKNVSALTEEDVVQIRMISSFAAYVKRNNLVEELDDLEHAKETIYRLMLELRDNIQFFYTCLKILHILVRDLPQSPLGKPFRELYITALTKDVAALPDYKQCQLLLGFIGRDQLTEKLDAILELFGGDANEEHRDVKDKLTSLKSQVLKACMSPKKIKPEKENSSVVFTGIKSRTEFKQKVAEIGKTQKVKTEFEETRDAIIDYLMKDLLPSTFRKMSNLPLREIVYPAETESRFRRVVPVLRSSIHSALTNPARYLECNCCRLSTDSDILASMPDICIAYKLHLECGSVINMYDWLQSFNLIIKGASDSQGDDDDEVDPQIQARFAQAVADMEFLGYIKSSTKADHVVRLTWGTSL